MVTVSDTHDSMIYSERQFLRRYSDGPAVMAILPSFASLPALIFLE